MKIRKNVTVFLNGSLQKVDLDEKGRVVVAGEVPKEKSEGKTEGNPKLELMKQLKEKGIKFNATLSAAALQELLDAAEKEKEAEKGKVQGGTGDQDVI